MHCSASHNSYSQSVAERNPAADQNCKHKSNQKSKSMTTLKKTAAASKENQKTSNRSSEPEKET